ncbi:class I SAM-dependent methyltransferase [Rhodococcus sp. NPDC049939]|uniref:class I SAM-dependent methyltransferase n=1 Tax=Rhodococcus sp. NPDC049939 TaxID=3155511 RepID=UPI0033E6137B
MSTLSPDADADTFSQRIFDASLGAIDVLSIHIGDRMGWYRSLATEGPATAEELAERTSTHPRYAREWLEHQAVSGFVTANSGNPRTFALAAGATEALTDERSLSYLAPLARQVVAAALQMPALLEVYRAGGGVGWAKFGADARESQADMNRPWYEQALPGALASVPEVDSLLRTPDAVIADVGCGGAWSTIALARAYPGAQLRGYDIDPATVELAKANVSAHPDVAKRITITESDATGIPEGSCTAAFAFECIHDMPDPVDVLAAARRALEPGGVLIVMDEAVDDEFSAPGSDLERFMYGISLTVCLPDGMSHTPSAGTGTVMRPSTLRGYAEAAGFSAMDILPIENFGFWRFYRLTV